MKYTIALSAVFAAAVSAQAPVYGQCGGIGWSGATTCAAGSSCVVSNAYYSQCLPGANTSKPSTPTTTTSKAPGSTTTTSKPASPTTSTPATPPSNGMVKLAGVNIAGFDFGCDTTGTCVLGAKGAYPPLGVNGEPDGPGQMKHFVADDGMNIFRLPVGWQYLTNGQLGGTLDPTNSATYDQLVQACLATGAYCIIDVHNYARWNGGIIGQGGPTNAQFAALWTSIATKYKSQGKVVFGIMNEPHDIPDINAWGTSVQAAVTAIRTTGATSQYILLPGNNYTSAQTYVSNGSLAALQKVTNLDGTTTNLIFDVHKYLDSDNSGTSTTCVTDNVSTAFAPLATSLRAIGRMALLSETGGGNTASCEQYLCSEIAFLNQNSDVYLGYVGWAAGSFDSTYALTETPTKNGNTWTDTPLVSQCLKR